MYQALYRKWRPQTFDDVVSQPHITTTLKNQIKNNRTAHAYLFTGSRGTGKTTCARIFAKAVNCLEKEDSNPCLKCDICRDAESFALSDIIEIDAASNNGVDDIRDLRDGAVYTPERCKYKIYIIDEVHMLSVSAFNALLKIMEEPPEYVKFILATTEVHKVPATITSRCQRYDFRRILPEDIAARLLYIAGQEEIGLSEDAAMLIARLADGGMRDALSLLDQCAAFSQQIDIDTVSSAAGIAGRDALYDIIGAVLEKKPAAAIECIDKLYALSKDMHRLCDELISQFRNLMLIKINPNQTKLLACMPDEIQRLCGFADKLGLQEITYSLSLLQQCSERLHKAINKRVELEMCIIGLASAQQTASSENSALVSELTEKLASLEKQLEELRSNPTPKPLPERTRVVAQTVDLPPQEQPVDMSKLKLSDFTEVKEWSEILVQFSQINPSVSATLNESSAVSFENIMLITAKNPFFLTLFRNKENAAALGEAIKKVLGKTYIVRAKSSAAADESSKGAMKLIEKAQSSNIDTAME